MTGPSSPMPWEMIAHAATGSAREIAHVSGFSSANDAGKV
jgi:hypothetical protein